MPLRDYADVVRQRWWVVVVTVLVAVVAAYGYTRTQAPVYRSSVRLEVTARIDYGQILALDRLLRQTAARIKTSGTAAAAADRLGADLDGAALLGKLQAQAYPDVLHIQIDVDDDSPQRAEQIAGVTAAVVVEQQAARMASMPQQERISLAVLDRPSAGRLVWPATRQVVLAAAVGGLVVGVLLTFGLQFLAQPPGEPTPAPPSVTG